MAGPIAIGIITVIHSRGERDFVAKNINARSYR
jgi:hypothetical protein